MSGDVQVRFCERLGVKLPGPTHLLVMAPQMDERLIGFIESKLENWMGLEINREKTRVVNMRPKGARVDFLGFTFRKDADLHGRRTVYLNVIPSKKALAAEREALRQMTGSRMCFKPTPVLIGELNRQLRGWGNYFQFGYPRKAFRDINAFVRDRVRRHLRRRSQRPYRLRGGVSWYEHLDQLGLISL